MLFEVFCKGSRRSFAHLEAGLRILEGPCLGLSGTSISIKQLAKPILIQHFNQGNMECAKISFISRKKQIACPLSAILTIELPNILNTNQRFSRGNYWGLFIGLRYVIRKFDTSMQQSP